MECNRRSKLRSHAKSTKVISDILARDKINDIKDDFEEIERKIFEASGIEHNKLKSTKSQLSSDILNKKKNTKKNNNISTNPTSTKVLSGSSKNSNVIVKNKSASKQIENVFKDKKSDSRSSPNMLSKSNDKILHKSSDKNSIESSTSKISHSTVRSSRSTSVKALNDQKPNKTDLNKTTRSSSQASNEKTKAQAGTPQVCSGSASDKIRKIKEVPKEDCKLGTNSKPQTTLKSKATNCSPLDSTKKITLKHTSSVVKRDERDGNITKKAKAPFTSKDKNVSQNVKGSKNKNNNSNSTSSSKSNAQATSSKKTKLKKKSVQSSDSEGGDWEDVEEEKSNKWANTLDDMMKTDEAEIMNMIAAKKEKNQGSISDDDQGNSKVEIELDAPTLWGMKKRKKKSQQEYWEDYLRRTANQGIRETFIHCHKVHLLLLLGHGQYINKLLSNEELLASALSIVTSQNVYPPKRIHLKYLEQFLNWFHKRVSQSKESTSLIKVKDGWKNILLESFEKKAACSRKIFVLMFISVGRALGMNVRLVQSLSPLHWKPTSDKLFKPPSKKQEDDPIVDSVQQSSSPDGSENISKESSSKSKKNKMISSDTDEEKSPVPAKKKVKGTKKKARKMSSDEEYGDTDSSDSDFESVSKRKNPELPMKTIKFLAKQEAGQKRRMSADAQANATKKRKQSSLCNWAEVYVEEEERWVSVDVVKCKVYCDSQIASQLPPPVGYVTAFNPDQTVKDVTKRYVSKWLAHESKLRCDSEWWRAVLKPYASLYNEREKMEDKHLDECLKQQPLPSTIAEYKNHPLYALQRHLLKFEALYPPNPDPVGFIRGEAVYPRSCVATLHSRNLWLRNGKTVKVDEEAYKIVKAMPKWDRVNCTVIKDTPLELFGEWQVENYKPPIAKDGKVPRNEYGNVELFTPAMLPGGCVHLDSQFKDLSRVARKLKIDVAPAIVGFEMNYTGTHPVIDGYVVCEEFKEVLLAAWTEEMELKKERAEKRRMQRIYDNWKRLVRGMLVRQRIREQYGGGEDDEEEEKISSEIKKTSKTKSKVPAKRKVKQKDIDKQANKEDNVAEEPVVLGIDFSSDTVLMAKQCLKNASKSARGVDRKVVNDDDVQDDSDGEKQTEEQKKESLRKILAWGKEEDEEESALELSDDSDDCTTSKEETCLAIKPSTSAASSVPSVNTPESFLKSIKGLNILKDKKKFSFTGFTSKQVPKYEEEDSNDEAVTSSSDEDDSKVIDLRPRKSRRSVAKKAVTYVESEESDISLGESDLDDKTFKPDEEL